MSEFVLEEDPNTDDEMSYSRTHPVIAGNLLNADQAGAIGVPVEGDDDDMFKTEDAESVQFMATKPWKGAIKEPSNKPRINPSAPDERLQLEWIYGYRGYDSRSNVMYNAAGRVVYPVAAVVVVYDPKSHSQEHFFGHNDDVICIAQHPLDKNIFASGQVATIIDRMGTPPHICVWDSSDMKQVWQLPNAHMRAVRTLGFSCDGKYLASVGDDDNYTVKIWDWQNKKVLATQKGDSNQIITLRWSNVDPKSFVTVGKNHIFAWSFNNGALTKTKARLGNYPWQTFNNLCFSEKGYACVGGRDGSLYVLVDGDCRFVMKNLHKSDLQAMERHPGGIVTGGGDGLVHFLDSKLQVVKSLKVGGKVRALYPEYERLLVGTHNGEIYQLGNWANSPDNVDEAPVVKGHFDGELWAMDPHPNNNNFATAGEDNSIFLFDLNAHTITKQTIISDKAGPALKVRKACSSTHCAPNQCARALAFSPDGREFIIGTNKGEVAVFRTEDMSVVARHDLNRFGKRQVTNQTENWIQTIKYSPTGNLVAVGTHGMVIVLLDPCSGYTPKGTLTAHNAAVLNMDFSSDGMALQSNCLAYELLFHSVDEKNPKTSKQNPSGASQYRDVKWATQTCLFGWPVQGVFDPTQDGSDVNSGDANRARTLYATGDDYGLVNLYRYPVVANTHEKRTGAAHASHVVTVRFTPDGQRLISTGGADKSVCQWRVAK